MTIVFNDFVLSRAQERTPRQYDDKVPLVVVLALRPAGRSSSRWSMERTSTSSTWRRWKAASA